MTTFARGGGGGMPAGLKALLKEGIVIDGQTIQIGQYVTLDGDKVSNEIGQDTTYTTNNGQFIAAKFTLIDETYGILVGCGIQASYSGYVAKIRVDGAIPMVSGSVLTVSGAVQNPQFAKIDSTYGILIGYNNSSPVGVCVAKINISGISPTLSGSVLNISGDFYNTTFALINATYGVLVRYNSGVNASVAKINISGASPTLSGSVLNVSSPFYTPTFALINATYGVLAGYFTMNSATSANVAKINISGTSPTLSGSILTVGGNFKNTIFTLVDNIYGILAGGDNPMTNVAKINISGASPTLSGSILAFSSDFRIPTFALINDTYGILAGYNGNSQYNGILAKINISGASPTLSGSVLTINGAFFCAILTIIDDTYCILAGHDNKWPYNGYIAKINISGISPTLSGSVLMASNNFRDATFTPIDKTYGILAGYNASSPYNGTVVKIRISGISPVMFDIVGIVIESKTSGETIKYIQGV